MTSEDDGFPVAVDPADLPTRRERRLAARAAARVDARGPRTGEFEVPASVRAAREAAGLPPELSATGRWRWMEREERRAAERSAAASSPERPEPGGRHRGRV